MRVGVAATGLLVFFVISLAASVPTTAVAPRGTVASVIGVAEPLATADPTDHSRVDPETQYGGLGIDDRASRRRVVVHGLAIPIEGATLPSDLQLLPNAARDYRAGWHEGIDFPADAGTPVRAIAPGKVVRIDHDFSDWDQGQRDAALDDAVRRGYTPAETLDKIRGRQVWIDHGRGVVSRYAHLSGVAALRVGDAVLAGQVIGTVGSTGYPDGGPHLHLEVRVGDGYLGDGLSGDALFAAITAAFD